ncbi:MAG TPA: sulfotransferase [Alphaproteobacteria bacterium]|nr:sulfotransferase [Alphaproteobacteria bacterium]
MPTSRPAPQAGKPPGRNDPCPCGSGRKYKHCCAGGQQRGVQTGAGPDAPDLFVAISNQGLAHLRAHRPAAAADCFRQAIGVRPRDATAHYNLAAALEQLGRDAEAIAAFRRAIELAPRFAEAHERIGNRFLALGRRREAIPHFRNAAKLMPDTALGWLSEAKALWLEGKVGDADAQLRRALERDSANGELYRLRGTVLRELGCLDEAIACLEKAVALAPDRAGAYYELVTSKPILEADRQLVDKMAALLSGDASTQDRISLNFALGKALDDLGEYERAIRHFDEGNALKRRGINFDRAQYAVGVDRLIASFTPDFFRSNAALGSDDETPILILGMMRSGTTLVEQIVSAHPEAGAAGELPFWYDRAEAFGKAGAAGLTAGFIGKVAAEYRALLHKTAPGSSRVTDKMPANFLWIGLIHLAFPKARIIHCRRHPVDTCLSIYMTDFASRSEYAYDKGDLAFSYKHYARLMDHWRAVLPPDRFLDVDYEELVADREGVTRRMLAFCGLDWNDACLAPERNRRVVNTASVWQVRQPVYRKSVERWRRYEPWLGELSQLLPSRGTSAVQQSRAAKDHLLLAKTLNEQGKTSDAIEVLENALRLSPHDPVVYNNLGLLHLAAQDLARAVDCFEKAIALDPDLATGHYNLGAARERQRDHDAAAACYRKAIALSPTMGEAYSRLGNLLQSRGDSDGAVECFRCASELAPDTPRGLVERAKILLIEEKVGEAEGCLRRSLAVDAANAEAHALLGDLLSESGRFEDAARSLREAIRLDPERVSAYHNLVLAKKATDDDRRLIETMAGLVNEPGRTDFERSLLHFALGKAFDDLGEHQNAIRHFDEGNRIEYRNFAFDRTAWRKSIDQLISTFTADFFARKAPLGSQSEIPILILGMPRSGTTLVEQIVSNHPKVGAGGELRFWNDRATALGGAIASRLDTEIPELAEEYLALLRRIDPDAARITDKMPFNFIWLGLIHLAFPKAKIIHCRRNPLDTCLSIYFLRFATRQAFAYDRGDLAFYYREYQRLMAHWRQVLPGDRLLEIDYEMLIADREAVTRRMIGFCGLEWNDACLRHEDNRRVVKTASLWQVRQPIYQSSVERWRQYEPWLGELRELLPGAPEQR